MRHRLSTPGVRLVVGLPRCVIVCPRSSVPLSFVLGAGQGTRAGRLRAPHFDASSLQQGRLPAMKAGVRSGRPRVSHDLAAVRGVRGFVVPHTPHQAVPELLSPIDANTQHLTRPSARQAIRTRRRGDVLMDQSSQDDTVVGVRPSAAALPGRRLTTVLAGRATQVPGRNRS